MLSFTDYTYENDHHGVFPLDTNSAGVLRKRAGGYGTDPQYLTNWPNEDADNADDVDEDS